jgi:hypothetical protein
MLVNGSTAIAGRSGDGKIGAVADAVELSSPKVPTKRIPLRAIVRISFCSSPLSPTALRAALMRLVSVESDTTRPPQTDAVAILDQENQQIEDLRLDRNRLGTAAQFAPSGIKCMTSKNKLHVLAPKLAGRMFSRNNQAVLTNKSSSRQSL